MGLLPKCLCGCGLEVGLSKLTDKKIGLIKGHPNRFLKGHQYKYIGKKLKGRIAWWNKQFKGKKLNEQHKKKISEGVQKFWDSNSFLKQKRSLLNTGKNNHFYGKTHNLELRRKLSQLKKVILINCGIKIILECKRCLKEFYVSPSRIQYNPQFCSRNCFKLFGFSNEHKLKLSNIKKRLYKEGKINHLKNSFFTKDRIKELSSNKEWYEKRIQASLKGLFKRPVKTELILNNLLQESFLNEWKYTGDGSFLIGYKNPDFININGKKICIEIYLPYFKIRDFESCENYEKLRSNHFEEYGWKTIFVKSNELNNQNELINKIKNFMMVN